MKRNVLKFGITSLLMVSMAMTGGLLAGAKKVDIVDTAVAAGSFETLVAAVQAAGLVDALKGDGPFTVFAPTDEAFASLPAGTVENLLKPENKDQLIALLTYHVVPGRVMSKDARPGSVDSLQGSAIQITESKGALMINQAKVISADIDTTNGVIHVIDAVIMPPMDRSSNSKPCGSSENVSVASNRL